MVDIWLDVFNSSELVWYRAAKLAENIENSGNIILTMTRTIRGTPVSIEDSFSL